MYKSASFNSERIFRDLSDRCGFGERCLKNVGLCVAGLWDQSSFTDVIMSGVEET